MFIEWKTEYETGNIMVDKEHHELIKLVNLIVEADESGHGQAAVFEALSALHRYVDKHFTDEEMLLDAVESHHLNIQRQQHDMLRNELDLLFQPQQGEFSRDTIHKLAQWAEKRLLQHFLTFDFDAFNDEPFG